MTRSDYWKPAAPSRNHSEEIAAALFAHRCETALKNAQTVARAEFAQIMKKQLETPADSSFASLR